MNAKIWIYSCLILSAAGVGVPYALQSAGREAPPEPLDLPAEEQPGEALVFAAAFDADGAAQIAAPAAALEADGPRSGPAGALEPGLDHALAQLENFLPRYGSGALDRLARGAAAGPGSSTRTDAAAATPGRELLEGFLASNPFSGIMQATDGDVALFGRRALRRGDELFDGRVRVQSIAARTVHFEADGASVAVALPPLGAGRSVLGFAAGAADTSAGIGEDPR